MPIRNVLIISDDCDACGVAALAFQAEQVRVTIAQSECEGLSTLRDNSTEMLFVDFDLAQGDGLTLIQDAQRLYPHVPIIVTTSQASLELSVDALRLGVADFVTKPLRRDQLLRALSRAGAMADSWPRGKRQPPNLAVETAARQLIAVSEPMQTTLAWARRVGQADVPILVWGETGSGKEVVARAAHGFSDQARGPFVKFECGALRHEQMEAILFGSQPIGASGAEPGMLEQAGGGVLYLNHVTELPKWMQSKLMQVIQEGILPRREGDQATPLGARIAASLHDDPSNGTARSKLINALYYYLSVAPIRVPPLWERRSDIKPLIDEFIKRTVAGASGSGQEVRLSSFSAQAMQRLMEYRWPGNVCELANLVRRAVLFADDAEISLAQLDRLLPEADPCETPQDTITVPFARDLRLIERSIVYEVVKRCQGNKSAAARTLGLHRRTLYRILESPLGAGLSCA